jgi:hypothetical protein
MADGLVFESAYVAVGTDGYDGGDPTIAEPLVPAATALGAEVYRAPVPAENFVVDSFLPGAYSGGPTSTGFLATTRLALTGDALADAVGAEATALGEAGLIARITAVGTSGLTLGDEFLLAHCHFPRVIITRYMKLSTAWPISYTYDVGPPPPVTCPSFVLGSETNPFVGDVLLTTDGDVATFAAGSYDAIHGGLEITGTITSLVGLESLLYVRDAVSIHDLPSLTTLAGLDALALIDAGLSISTNALLTQVALDGLVEVVGNLTITSNPVLASLDGSLGCLATVGGVIQVAGNGI